MRVASVRQDRTERRYARYMRHKILWNSRGMMELSDVRSSACPKFPITEQRDGPLSCIERDFLIAPLGNVYTLLDLGLPKIHILL